MPKEIIFNGDEIINSTDYKAKAEKVIEELGKTVFAQFDEIEEANRPQKFYKNQINPVLTPMQVDTKLNRLLRVYKPLTKTEAETIDDTDYLDAFGYYCDIISYINDYLVYPPSKQTFCAFVNITTDIYNDFLENPNYQQVFKSFEDSFIQANFSGAQAGIVDSKSTMAKLQAKDVGHSVVANQESVIYNIHNSIDKQQVNLKLAQFDSLTKQIGNGKGKQGK